MRTKSNRWTGASFAMAFVGCGGQMGSAQGGGGQDGASFDGATSDVVSVDSPGPGMDAASEAVACGGADLQSDPVNCGSCGHDCLGGTCQGGRCQPAVFTVCDDTPGSSPTAVAADATGAYWGCGSTLLPAPCSFDAGLEATCTAGSLHHLADDTATPATFGIDVSDPNQVLVDGADLFVNELALGSNATVNGGQVLRCPVSGCPPSPQVVGTDTVGPIALGTTYVLWLGDQDSLVHGCPKTGGGACLVIQSFNSATFVADATNVYLANASPPGTATPITVVAVPLNGMGPPNLLYQESSFTQVGWLTLGSSALYWTEANGSQSSIRQCQLPSCGGAPTTLATAGNGTWLTADATNLYWTDGANLVSCATSACNPTVIAPLPGQLSSGVAVSSKAYYWLESAAHSSRLYRLAK